jgi:hypothetical protein
VPYHARYHSRTLVAIALAVLCLTSAGAASQGSSTLDPCALITKAEVEAATKMTVVAGVKSQVANLATCEFADPRTPATMLATLNVLVGTKPADATGAFEIAKSNAASVDAVAGVGERAYWDKYLRTLRATKGRYQIDLTLDSSAGGLDAAKTIVTKAASRLPAS